MTLKVIAKFIFIFGTIASVILAVCSAVLADGFWDDFKLVLFFYILIGGGVSAQQEQLIANSGQPYVCALRTDLNEKRVQT